MEESLSTKALKTPSPPKLHPSMRLFLESLNDSHSTSNNNDRAYSQSDDNQISNNNNNHNNQLHQTPKLSYQKSLKSTFHSIQTPKPPSSSLSNPTTDEFKTAIREQKPISIESQSRQSLTCRSRLGNTGDALTGIVKKYRELQAKSKVSLVLDDSSDDDDDDENVQSSQTTGLSDTPSFRCSSEDDEEPNSSQCTNSIESSSNKNLNNKDNKVSINKNIRQYRSEPQLSSFEDSEDPSLNGGMYQDSIRYHSQNALKKSVKVFETVTVCNVDYFILNEIGEGGSSKVYQVCDCENKEFYALKVVDMAKMADSLKNSLMKEIEILKMLKGCKRVIQLYDYEWNEETEKLMLVMEKGDSDLNTVLSKMIQSESSSNGNKKKSLDLHTIKHYWNEMLKAVDEIHKKDIVHSDLKPVNFVIVKGYLKIIDFGIADAINPDQTSVVKSNLVGTINFMSPESLISRPSRVTVGKKEIKVKCKSDVWSLGCILYNMCYGRTPFGHIEQIYEKIAAICNPKYVINYPPYENLDAIDCMKKCLDRNINSRPSVSELFQHPFLNRDKMSRLPLQQSTLQSSRIPSTSTARNSMLNKRIFDDLEDVNKLTPRSLAKFTTVMKKELTNLNKFKK